MARVVVDTAGWIRGDSDAETVEVQMRYDPADPLAVTLRVNAQDGEDVWVFGRDLLADGLRSMVPVGEGAVHVQATSVLTEVSRAERDGTVTVLRLPWWNTREFIRLSLNEVPRGRESCDVDSWVTALTATQEP
jgi:hypothetical protein